MKRCDVCNGYQGEPTPVKVGDKVDFVIEKLIGCSIRMTTRTGKLMLIKEKGFSVIYRGTVYHADSVSSPADPSPISLAMFGTCTCKEESL